MCSAIPPDSSQLNNGDHSNVSCKTVTMSDGSIITFMDQNQLTKEYIKNTGEVSFVYSQDRGSSKTLSLRIGRDTPFFSNIQSENNPERVKTLILEHVSSLFEVHEIGKCGIDQLQNIASGDFSIINPKKRKASLSFQDKACVTSLELSEIDVSDFDLSEFTSLEKLDLQDAKGNVKAMFNAIPSSIRASIEHLDLSDVNVIDFDFSGFINLKNLDLENAKGCIEDVFNTIPFDVRASIKDLDLDGADIRNFDFSGFTALKSLCLGDGQTLTLAQREQLPSLEKLCLPEEALRYVPKEIPNISPGVSSHKENAKKITSLIELSTKQGESWKESFSSIKTLTSRLRPAEVINDCMQAMEEISFHKQTVFKTGGDQSVLLEKKVLAVNTEVITTGDLHGDAFSLAKMLEKLQVDGKLTEDFELVDNIELVFLGDYVDRGPDSWSVLNMITRLKLNNMNEVHLIRGNHEDTGQIFGEGVSFGDWMSTDNDVTNRTLTREYRYLQDGANNSESRALDHFFDTLLNAVFLGVEQGGEIEFDIYTHGAVPLSFNPNKLLASDDGTYSIPRNADELGEHSFSSVSSNLGSLSQEERLNLIRSVSVVKQAVKKHRPQLPDNSVSSTVDTEWNWGDITVVNQSSHQTNRGACVNLGDFVEWMDCSKLAGKTQEAPTNVSFRRFFKGHSHQQAEIVRDSREFYFLDTDLYAGGNFIMHSHQMNGSKPKVDIRPYRGVFVEGASLGDNEDF
jgi:hypothetical protein